MRARAPHPCLAGRLEWTYNQGASSGHADDWGGARGETEKRGEFETAALADHDEIRMQGSLANPAAMLEATGHVDAGGHRSAPQLPEPTSSGRVLGIGDTNAGGMVFSTAEDLETSRGNSKQGSAVAAEGRSQKPLLFAGEVSGVDHFSVGDQVLTTMEYLKFGRPRAQRRVRLWGRRTHLRSTDLSLCHRL